MDSVHFRECNFNSRDELKIEHWDIILKDNIQEDYMQ